MKYPNGRPWTARTYSWEYLQDYCIDKWGVWVKAYSRVKRITENSCIDWVEL